MQFAYRSLIRICGLLAAIMGCFMVPPLICALYFHEHDAALAFASIAPIVIVSGFLVWKLVPRSKKSLQTRDAYLIVMTCWIGCAFIVSLPYMISGEVPNFCDAFFEAVAGLTSTGASALAESDFTMPLTLWKAITHWIGGMGVLVFVITILPALGPGGQRLVAAESPGSGLASSVPRSHELAKLLYFIYGSLTFAEFLMLWIGSEMNAYESLINSLGSISTAGLFLHDGGIAYYDSLYVELVISGFTILASLNFMLFIYLIKGNFEYIKRNMEIRYYLSIIAAGTILITLSLYFSDVYSSFGETLRHAFFQVTAFMTTSGFTLQNYMGWPAFCKVLLFVMLFVGGCMASTAGSIKIVRVVIVAKLIKNSFFRMMHPRSVRVIKMGDTILSSAMLSSITGFVILYFVTFFVGSLVLSLQGLDLESTLSATASLMSTTGLAFGSIGDSGSFAMFSHPLKMFMSFLMIVGRLELFTFYILLFPSFWNPNRAKVR